MPTATFSGGHPSPLSATAVTVVLLALSSPRPARVIPPTPATRCPRRVTGWARPPKGWSD